MITQEFFDESVEKIKAAKNLQQHYEIKNLVWACFKTAKFDYICGQNDARKGLIKQKSSNDGFDFYELGYEAGSKK